MPCLFSYNGITKQDGRAATLPLFLFPLHFDHTHYPYFFSFVLGERRIVKMRRSSFFFRSDFCQREIPSQNPTDIRKKMPSLVYINARGRNICFTKRKKHAVFLSDTSLFLPLRKGEVGALFAAPQRRGAVFSQNRQSGLKKLSVVYRRLADGPQPARNQPVKRLKTP